MSPCFWGHLPPPQCIVAWAVHLTFKFLGGAWLPLAIAAVVFTLMMTWARGGDEEEVNDEKTAHEDQTRRNKPVLVLAPAPAEDGSVAAASLDPTPRMATDGTLVAW